MFKDSDEIRKLGDDELEMVTGGKTGDIFKDSRLARLFSDGKRSDAEMDRYGPGRKEKGSGHAASA